MSITTTGIVLGYFVSYLYRLSGVSCVYLTKVLNFCWYSLESLVKCLVFSIMISGLNGNKPLDEPYIKEHESWLRDWWKY